jgi:hypothetical protein
MKSVVLPTLLTFLSLTLLSGCIGDTEERILGRWELIENSAVGSPADTPMQIEFFENNTFRIYHTLSGASFPGKYELSADLSHRRLRIYDIDNLYKYYKEKQVWTRDFRAEHVVTKLTSNVLILTTNRFSPNSRRHIDQFDFIKVSE